MVGLALLLGCDFCPQGVPGVGKEGAMKLLRHCKASHAQQSEGWSQGQAQDQGEGSLDLLALFQLWSGGKLVDKDSAIEKQVKK